MLGWLALAAGIAAGAPQPAGDADAPIVVTGAAHSPEATRQQAVALVDSTGISFGERPIARWADPVCPRVIGIAEPYARIVEARMRSIAATIPVRVGGPSCKPNIVVSFALDAGAVVRAIAARSPRSMAEIPSGTRTALLTGTAPIRWWYASEPRTSAGSGASSGSASTSVGGSEGGGSVLQMGDGVRTFQHYDSSVISTQTIRVLTGATVVVDLKQAEGLPLTAVAAYAAMVAFAEIRPSAPPRGSILGLSTSPDSPRALSEWDTALLRALYRVAPDRAARQQRSAIIADLIAQAKK